MEERTSNSHKDCFQRLRALGLEPRDKEHHKPLSRASVLVLLFVNDENQLCTLITKRSMNLRSHPGECCFPGGRQDDQDENDDIQTALREAQEEIGLQPQHVEILGRLSTVESVNHLCVTSIIAQVNDDSAVQYKDFMRDYPWKMNRDEVDSAFAVPLQFFLQEPQSIWPVQWSRETFYMRIYEYHDKKQTNQFFSITGLTAHIAHEVATITFEATPSASHSKKIKTIRQSDQASHNDLSGYLWKRELTSRGRPYWTQKYFVHDASSAPFLHQYDNQQQAFRKAQTANKKNRLPLQDYQVVVIACDDSPQQQSKYEFVLESLGGRLQWHLAAPTHEDRERWVRFLQEASKNEQERSA